MEIDPHARTGLARLGPLLFGAGFLAPVIAQAATRSGYTEIAGLPPLAVGLAIGIAWGTRAMLRGRWI